MFACRCGYDDCAVGGYSNLQESKRTSLKFRVTGYLLAFFITWVSLPTHLLHSLLLSFLSVLFGCVVCV